MNSSALARIPRHTEARVDNELAQASDRSVPGHSYYLLRGSERRDEEDAPAGNKKLSEYKAINYYISSSVNINNTIDIINTYTVFTYIYIYIYICLLFFLLLV